jgi:outer membrane translocation and assembly module TamA
MLGQLNVRLRVSLLLGVLSLPDFVCAQTCVNTESQPDDRAQKAKITITTVEFDADSEVPEDLRAQLLKQAGPAGLYAVPGEPDSSWIGVPANEILGTLQSHGYFRALVDPTPFLVRAEFRERFYVLQFRIVSGPQFQLGEIRFKNAELFSSAELREAFLLRKGDVFDVSKIREGLESISRLYFSKGYADMVAGPETTLSEDKRTVDVLIRIDEGMQYRIRGVDVLGLPKRAEDLLRCLAPSFS